MTHHPPRHNAITNDSLLMRSLTLLTILSFIYQYTTRQYSNISAKNTSCFRQQMKAVIVLPGFAAHEGDRTFQSDEPLQDIGRSPLTAA